ncbi:MAG: 2Fe-2S iron-sulfur cluster-binding protein [Shimia thalassica]|uniref:MOSC domain-containing protein n=2 Tax=Roseobacteraceae TaxID=2854170 RepID=UPI003298CF27
MSIRPDLTVFKLETSEIGARVVNPQGQSAIITSDSTVLTELSDSFEKDLKLYHRRQGCGYWDHEDAALSIINLATIEDIAQTLGIPVDPLQFRANIYVRAEPWVEFQWLGRALETDEITLDIIRPIDRCKTTSVDVKTGKSEVNMPAALQQFFGHMYCGVYASVRKGGQLRRGAAARVSSSTETMRVQKAVGVATAPKLTSWPRPARISDVQHETHDTTSFWLEDSLGALDASQIAQPGQYIRLHDLAGGHTWRSYTVSAIRKGQLRITVKCDTGLGSQAVHRLKFNDIVTISGPFGDATLRDECEAFHFVSAGIGITPSIAKLTALAEKRDRRPIVVTHVAKSQNDLVLWGDVTQAAGKLPNVDLRLHLTREADLPKGAVSVRPDVKALIAEAKATLADLHICGPTGFVAQFEREIEDVDVPRERVSIDRFTSPGVAMQMRDISPSPPITVTLQKSKISAEWRPEDGTLLEFIESLGIVTPAHCRAGICKSCQCNIASGSAQRLTGSPGDDTQRTLICSSVPSGALVLDI